MQRVPFDIPGESEATKPHTKLDARLATLAVLKKEAYGTGIGKLERLTSGLHREGPLAFSRINTSQMEADPGEDVVDVFLTVRETAAFDRLKERLPSLVLRSRAKTVATAEVRLVDLPALEASGDVVAIEWTGAVRPAAGPAGSGPAHGARAALGLDGAPAELDGRGCLIGIVDVEGIDLYHPAFVDATGRTRLRALWDQRAPAWPLRDAAPHLRGSLTPRRYGVLYDRAALDYELSPKQLSPNDIVKQRAMKRSHGTASASLAAGLTFGNGVTGVAGGAELVFVNTWGSGVGALGAMTELADAIAFVFEVADADGKPCVVNVSLGDDLGPRNGRSPVERFIDEIAAAKGRTVVVAAGNSRCKNRHVEACISEGETVTLDIDVGPGNSKHAAIEIWYRAESEGGRLEVQLEAPDGEGRTEPIPADGVPRGYDARGTRALVISMPEVAANPGDELIRVELLPLLEGAPLLSGTWRLHLRATGARCDAHAWLDHRYIRFLTAPDEAETNTLTTPATTRGAITVGAYCVEEGRPYWFSGRGPGRGDVCKPDVVAPGGPLLAAAGSTTVRATEVSGTSAAAALVSGAVALAYQRFGASLSRDELLSKLVAGARAGHDSHAGWGLVHLGHWLAEPLPRTDSAPVVHFTGEGAATRDARDSIQIMLGTYVLYQEERCVGHLVVTPGRGEGRTVETWLLRDNYRSPSADVPRTQIKFVYERAPIRLQQLLALEREKVTVIRAECVARRIGGDATCAAALPAVAPGTVASNETAPGEAARDAAAPNTAAEDSISAERLTPRNETVTNQRSSTMSEMNQSRPTDGVQIMLGEYKLYQTAEVGKLYVEELAGPTRTREHWILYSSYCWPSQEYPSQQITFNYQGRPGQLSSFLSGIPSGSTYIIADCAQQTLP